MATHHRMKADTGRFHLQTGAVTAKVRYSFTAQFVGGAVLLARRAQQIEGMAKPDGLMRAEHRASVVAAIMQASASLEAELAEVLQYGPGHQLGSKGIDKDALKFLQLIGDAIDRYPGVIERWELLLHVLRRPAMEKGKRPCQEARLLVGLRNELVHYRSNWEGTTTKRALLGGLRAKRFARPPFVEGNANDFPHTILGAECAMWACRTAAHFLDEVCAKLGVPSVLDPWRSPGADLAAVIPARRP